ncbi:EamA family transporter [bacterium]|nr:EamA family transporter [bacterium]
MTHPDATAARTGILFLAFAIFCFTAMDALAKHMIALYPTIEVIWARNVGQLFFVLLYFGPRLRQAVRTRMPGWHLLRSMTQLGATVFFFVSLNYIGLAEATALADINPVLITLGAALFLGERLSRARVTGVLAALVGALIITRPGLGVFSWAALLPLICAFSYAGNMLLTRLVGARETPAAAMFYAAAFGSVATSAVLPAYWQPIPWHDLPMFTVLGALGAVAQLFTIRAYSRAQATVLAPFGYLDMVFAVFWSGAAFGAWPDRFTLLGALVIALAGLYVWAQERSGPRIGSSG